MFVGHYSVAFACRTERNKIPLWVLFVAVQFLDYIWATLVLLGIEKLRVIKGLHGRQHARLVFSPVFAQFDHGGDLERQSPHSFIRRSAADTHSTPLRAGLATTISLRL